LVMEPDRTRGVPRPTDGATGRVDMEPEAPPPPPPDPEPKAEREPVPGAGSRHS
jgi:hypothetical protein